MKLILALLLAATPGAAGPAPMPAAKETVTPAPTLDRFIAICRLAFIDIIQGNEPARAKAAIEALPKKQRPIAVAICTAYATGQQDLHQVMSAQPEPEPLPSGGTTI